MVTVIFNYFFIFCTNFLAGGRGGFGGGRGRGGFGGGRGRGGFGGGFGGNPEDKAKKSGGLLPSQGTKIAFDD